jgi:hypothetical protein
VALDPQWGLQLKCEYRFRRNLYLRPMRQGVDAKTGASSGGGTDSGSFTASRQTAD